jgi:hypothetical protein
MLGMYLEALRAMDRNDGPEALHVAAYELREFMYRLPELVDVPVVGYDQLKSRVRTFVDDCKLLSARSTCLSEDAWGEPIDDSVRRLLHKVTDLITWVEQEVPSRRAGTEMILKRLAPTEFPVPQVAMDELIGEWGDLLGWFNGCTHHNITPKLDELRRKLGKLEQFLLNHLEPRTFEDQDSIDGLIHEVEGP